MVFNTSPPTSNPILPAIETNEKKDPPLPKSTEPVDTKTATVSSKMILPPVHYPENLGNRRVAKKTATSCENLRSPTPDGHVSSLENRTSTSSSTSILPAINDNQPPPTLISTTHAQRLRKELARPVSPTLPVHSEQYATKNPSVQLVKAVFCRSTAHSFLELKRALMLKKKLLDPKEHAAFDLCVAQIAPTNFSLYFLNSCTDPCLNSTHLSCDPQAFLASVVARLREKPNAPLAVFFRRLRKDLQQHFGQALMGNASDEEILTFVKTLLNEQREDIGTFALKFQEEWIKKLLHNGKLANVLQKAHRSELEQCLSKWKSHPFKQGGLTNSLAQSYLSFIHRSYTATHAQKMIQTILQLPNWHENLVSNTEQFTTVLIQWLTAVCEQPQQYLTQMVLTIRRRVVEDSLPPEHYPGYGKHFAVSFLLDCLRNELKTIINKQFTNPDKSDDKEILLSFWKTLDDLKAIQAGLLEQRYPFELAEEYPVAFTVWLAMEGELDRLIEENTQYNLKV